jgi:AraC-like DNA-binding protein
MAVSASSVLHLVGDSTRIDCDGLHGQATFGPKLDDFGQRSETERVADRWDLLRSPASAALLTDLAGEHGVPAEVVLAGTDIPNATLRDPEAEITAGQELRLLRNLIAALGDVPALGLEAGTRYHAAAHGIWGFAVLSSPSVRDALDIAIRFFELSFSFAEVRQEIQGDRVTIVIDDRDTPEDVRRFLAERDLAGLATLQRDLLGTVVVADAFRVRLPQPAYVDRYVEVTGNLPEFDADLTSVTISSQILDLPLPQANPHTATMCERQCVELLQRRHARLGIAGEVRDLLARRSAITDQEDVARELNVSVRTLRRQLAEEGTSFRELSAEVSRLLAEELLGSGLSVEEVAHRLGYSGASAFTHAFRRWHGVTPGQFARSARRTRTVSV